jgi:hypothetical protein
MKAQVLAAASPKGRVGRQAAVATFGRDDKRGTWI